MISALYQRLKSNANSTSMMTWHEVRSKQDIYNEASAIWEQQTSSAAMGARNPYADEMGADRFRYSVSGGRACISAIGVMGIVAGRRDLERSDRCCLDRD